MGTRFTESGADYSTISLGHAGLYTSVSTGLVALFETRRSASKAINNSAPGSAPGTILGAPTFSAGSAAVAPANKVSFATKPAGSHTIIAILKVKNGGTTADGVVGSYLNPTTAGAAYFTASNWRVSVEAVVFPAGAVPPLSGAAGLIASIDMPAVANFEMVAAVMESGVSLRLHRPKTGTLVSATAVGKDFAFNNPGDYGTVPLGAAAQDVALFAQWNRVLTPAEIATFYAEIQPQYARLGLAI